MKNSMAFPQKKVELSYDSIISFQVYTQKKLKQRLEQIFVHLRVWQCYLQ